MNTNELLDRLLEANAFIKISAISPRTTAINTMINNSSLPFPIKIYSHLVNRLVPKTQKFLNYSNFGKSLGKIDRNVTDFINKRYRGINNTLSNVSNSLDNYMFSRGISGI